MVKCSTNLVTLSWLDCSDAAEEIAKEELRQTAKQELEEWYKHHAESIAKTKAANR